MKKVAVRHVKSQEANRVRKKSHISVAKYIVNNINTQELDDHKKAFYLGSILPDCKPSFLTKKHEFTGTFEQVREDIRNLTVDCDIMGRNERVYWRRLGEVIHYMADYFTFPHNHTYEGNLKDHCIYEKHLKKYLKSYIKSGEAIRQQKEMKSFKNVDGLFSYIEASHKEYLKFKRSVEEDVKYIILLCQQVVVAIVQLLNKRIDRFPSAVCVE